MHLMGEGPGAILSLKTFLSFIRLHWWLRWKVSAYNVGDQGSIPELASSLREGKWQPTPVSWAWKISWAEEPGGLQSMGSLGVRHDWMTSLSLFTFMHWRRKWQPTPVFLPGESQGQGSLVGCHLWGRRESDTTEPTQQQQQHKWNKCLIHGI